MAEMEVTVDHLGALGDGVAETPTGRMHVPLTAPGDCVRIATTGKDRADLIEVLASGPDRVLPPCAHFGRCGGCALQHLAPAFVADWKRRRVVATLSRAGLAPEIVNPTISIPPQTRRRATLAARRVGKQVVLGFTERASHRLVDLEECRVMRRELVALIAPLRVRLPELLKDGEAADVAVTLTDTGINLLLIRQRALDLGDREVLAAMAEELDLAGLSWQGKTRGNVEPIAVRRTPVVLLDVQAVSLPAGAFLQPSAEGQAALWRLVGEALKGVDGRIVDLFSGVGTFAVPISAYAPVTAYDSDRDAIDALTGLKSRSVTARQRDLFREPLTAKELDTFQAAILDPPRAGALAQAKMLAESHVPLVAYVSCNPSSFARDAAILADGGYVLEAVTPVDQFLWSPHIELVGIFHRSKS